MKTPITDVPLRIRGSRTGIAHRVAAVELLGWAGQEPVVRYRTVCGGKEHPYRFVAGVGYPTCPECWPDERGDRDA